MILENLIEINKLKQQQTNREEIVRLLAAAERNIKDSGVVEVRATTRFDVAYKAIMPSALVCLRASGYRPSMTESGFHVTIIQSLPMTLGIPIERMIVLDAMRKKRYMNNYNGNVASEEEADSCVRAAEALLVDVTVWLKNKHPEYLWHENSFIKRSAQ